MKKITCILRNGNIDLSYTTSADLYDYNFMYTIRYELLDVVANVCEDDSELKKLIVVGL